MTPEVWLRVRAIFEAALDVPAASREVYLAQACAGDVQVQGEVRALLRADARDAGASPLLDGQQGPGTQRRDLLGTTIGGFRIVRMIGCGGMGAVYEALQSRPQRKVAFKTLSVRFPSERALRRFEDEAEILARLQHPAIAQVLEAGSARLDDLDVPWFAMELVDEPAPIDRWVRAQQLDVRGVASLLASVCDAVHYAHQRGVIHRDLKPANVLVDRHGRVKVIDFGIARLADPESLAKRTRTGEILGTLAYMSPERLERADAGDDTAGDVYALGVILYELLVGDPPVALSTLPPARALEALRAADPAPPSTRARRVPMELDWITMRAMDREPGRRYASAAELGADLTRWLRGDPVTAREPSATYRLRKLAWRHRVLLVLAAGVFVAVSAGFVIAALGWRRVAAAERQAQKDAAVLKQVNDFQQHVLRGAYGSELGRDVRLSDALATAARELEQRSFDDPWVEVGVRSAMAISYIGLGQLETAERHLLRARDVMTEHALDPRSPPGIAVRHNLATCYANLGRLEAAERELETVLEDRLATLGPDAELTARAQSNLASLVLKRARPAEALALAQAALATFERQVGSGSEEAINARSTAALSLSALARDVEADREFETTRALAEQHLVPDHPARLAAASVRGTHLHRRGRYRDALAVNREVAAARERLLGGAHPDTLTAWSNVGADQLALGDHAAAEAAFQKVLAGQLAAGLEGYPVIVTRQNLVSAQRRQGRAEQAEPMARAQRAEAARHLSADHWLLGVVTKEHGGCLRDLGRLAEAEPVLLEAHALLSRVAGPRDFRTQKVVAELVALYAALGPAEALQTWRARLVDEGQAGR